MMTQAHLGALGTGISLLRLPLGVTLTRYGEAAIMAGLTDLAWGGGSARPRAPSRDKRLRLGGYDYDGGRSRSAVDTRSRQESSDAGQDPSDKVSHEESRARTVSADNWLGCLPA